ncbi:hypothetical protein LMG18090_04389 [Ralstonia mannitolilytica]|uniref:hypothetical protein n=1 Tax=Ralstonia mannitolilytica TaxID=105219 RepID=UPI0028F629CF|nr:hypothetical protein [Ralstonia mannitolilytica]CAJ0803094.1 hypothetical protein LMG18090_04389 [Ralstonia mannitolilytica]
MKYANEVIEILKAQPHHKFRMYEIMHAMKPDHGRFESMRFGVHRALRHLCKAGLVSRETAILLKKTHVYQICHTMPHHATTQ